MSVTGYLDWPRGRELIGWVHDPARPGARLRVEIRMDGIALQTRTAGNFRADLQAVGIGDGFHAFSLELPPAAFDGNPHVIEAAVMGSDQVLRMPPYQSRYTGGIASIGPSAVLVHIADDSRPGVEVEAELYADGRLVAIGKAPQIRLPQGFEIDRVGTFVLRAVGSTVPVAELDVRPPQPVLSSVAPVSGEPVDIVVSAPPGAVTSTLRTLESIASASGNSTLSQVYAMAPADDGVLRSMLEEARIRLGFSLDSPAGGRDVVHLAAGSLVSGDWLDRLRAGAYSNPDVATVSPLVGGPVDAHTARSLDALCARVQPERFGEIFTPSEVCHYRRAGAGSLHLLAGGVRVEAFGPVNEAIEDRDHTAHALRRVFFDKLPRPAPRSVSTERGDTIVVDGWRYRLPEDRGALANVLPSVTVDSILWPPRIPVSYEVVVNDYGWICPRGDLIDETGRYCGEPVIEACERCFRKLGPRIGWGSILHRCGSVAELREQSRTTLEAAALVRFPSRDAADRIRRYMNPSRISVEDPGPGESRCPPKPRLRAPERLRVGLGGPMAAIWDACVLEARKRESPLDFVAESTDIHVEFFASEAPALRLPQCRAYPVRFDIGVSGPGLRIAPGLPASRINAALLREFLS